MEIVHAFTMQTSFKTANDPRDRPAHTVRRSPIHGTGVFARRAIRAGECIIEYLGERISWKEACRRTERNDGPAGHTFLFDLSNGKLIDGGSNGNDARWINHGCEPNCEAREEEGRVFIYALKDIRRGEELQYDYALQLEGRHTAALKREFACLCQAPSCRLTMLATKRKKRA